MLTRQRWIQLHSDDNIAVALQALASGEQLTDGVCTEEAISLGHKIALCNVAAGEPILRYGYCIGYAKAAIRQGTHVHTHNLEMGRLSDDSNPLLSTAVPPDPTPIKGRTFMGFRRPDGRVATRNYILIASTVNCSGTVCRRVAERFTAERLQEYENVDGVFAITHNRGCGLATHSIAHERMNRVIAGHLEHANVAARIVVGLGCEKGQAEFITEPRGLVQLGYPGRSDEEEVPLSITMQEEGGTLKTIDRIERLVERMLPQVNRFTREPIPASELVLATQCGGSDGLSGITANPAVGVASDRIVACGGTSFFAEITETFGAGHLITTRAKTPEVARKYLAHIEWWKDYFERNGAEFQHNTAVGNIQGGLTTVAEKALGSVAKGGSSPISEVFDYAEQVTAKGLCFMNTPAYDPVSCTAQNAGGALVGLFTTGRGSCFGSKPVPWIKVASNSAMYERMQDDMDVNAGRVVEDKSLSEVGEEIFEQILAVASGQQTRSERLGYGDNEFTLWDTGVTT